MNTNINKLNIFHYVDNFSKHDHIESKFIFMADNYESADITIIVPTYKRVDTLKETLNSILSQKGDINYTIIVLDNNPERDDETELLMKKFSYSKISYVKNNENLGMAGNWNRGFMLAKSQWVCLLHDDDVIVSSFLEEMFPYLNDFTDAAIIQSRKYKTKSPNIKPENTFNNDVIRYYALDFHYYHIIDVPSGIFYKKDIVIKEGGFNPDFYPSLDYVFHMKLAYKYKVYVVNKYLTWYRIGEQNASKLFETQRGWLIVDFYAIYQLLKKYCIPQLVILPYLELRTEERNNQVSRLWNTSTEIPYDHLIWKGYSTITKNISKKIILIITIFNRRILRR